jgi:putative ABC transport system permease protein
MDSLAKDLRYAVRTLGRAPGFTLIAVATLALGIGACTAIFSVVHGVMLRPLPYSQAERLVIVWGELRARAVPDWPFAPPDYRDLRQQATQFEGIAAVMPGGRPTITGDGGQPEQVRVMGATTNLFAVLGARVAAGRDFVEADGVWQPQPRGTQAPRLPRIAILSHGFWQRRYGGDAGVVGRSIDLGGGRADVVGVLAPGFELLFPPRAGIERLPDIWTALRIDYENASRNNVSLRVVGRMKPGVSVEQASADVEAVSAELRLRFPMKQTAGLHFRAVPMHADLVKDVRPAMLALMGAVVFVLLIACANVANLLVVRSAARSRELAIRAAVGGSRFRLVRQLLAESLVVAGGGTLLGLALADAGIQALLSLAPADLPRLDHVSIDPAVLAFTVAAGLSTALACGMLPALRASRPDVMAVLRQGSGAAGLRAGRLLRNAVVTTEVALSFVLLVACGLMLRSFAALHRIDPGYDPRGVLTFSLQARLPQPAQRADLVRQVRERLQALPGVRSVSAASPLPLDGDGGVARYGTEQALADPTRYRTAAFHVVLPGYFETLRTRIVAGRAFSEADNASDARQVVIDEPLARTAFPGETAVGKRLLVRVRTEEPESFEVIGVVSHQRHASLAEEGREALFVSDGYFGHGRAARWAVRADGDPVAQLPAIRAAIAAIDPQVVLTEATPMTTYVQRAMAPLRFAATSIGIFAAIAVSLAAVGLYGVLSTVVRQRTAEIGMRMVCGASRGSILGLVVGEGMRLSAGGVGLGLLAAFGLTRVLRSMLVGVQPADPLTFAAITLVFFWIAGMACWLPARRAAGLDPTAALRHE